MPDSLLLNVFLIYARADKDEVSKVYKNLKKVAWINPKLDTKDLSVGQKWEDKIFDYIENFSDVVLIFLSNISITRPGYIQKEIRVAVEKSELMPEGVIFIVPIRLEDCGVPRILRKYHYEDYFLYKNKKGSYDRILKSLKDCARNKGIPVDTSKKIIELTLNLTSKNMIEACITASRLLGVDKQDIIPKKEKRNTTPVRLFVELTERSILDFELELRNKNSDYYSQLKYVRHRIFDEVHAAY